MIAPAKWFFVTLGIVGGTAFAAIVISPSLRYSFVTSWEVRGLIRFRDQFRMENYELSCPGYRVHRAAGCVLDTIREQDRLRFASLTARIYFLSTIVSAAEVARGSANAVVEMIEARLDILEYLNEEMKLVLVHTGGTVDLELLDSRLKGVNLVEDPEVVLRRQYYANLVDLWIKNWRRDEKFLVANIDAVDYRTQLRIRVLRADRDELFSRLSIDLSRYERKRLPAGTAFEEPSTESRPPPPVAVASPTPPAPPAAPTPASPGLLTTNTTTNTAPERAPSATSPTVAPTLDAVPPLPDYDEPIEIDDTADNS
jgi:hypothetical protein